MGSIKSNRLNGWRTSWTTVFGVTLKPLLIRFANNMLIIIFGGTFKKEKFGKQLNCNKFHLLLTTFHFGNGARYIFRFYFGARVRHTNLIVVCKMPGIWCSRCQEKKFRKEKAKGDQWLFCQANRCWIETNRMQTNSIKRNRKRRRFFLTGLLECNILRLCIT